jgi:ubiquinone/menaquinone biosynthesis C-methylase UbiE
MKKSLDRILQNTHDQALRRRARLIIENLNLVGNEKVLDAGCGDGYYIKLLLEIYPNLEIYGLDIDSKALEVAKINLEKELKTKKLKIFERSITETQFQDNFFDAAFSSEVLEHVPNHLDALLEIKRVLKNEKKYVVTVPNFNFPFMWDPLNWVLQKFLKTHIKSGFFAGIWNQHIRLYTIDSFMEIVSDSDMKTELIKAVTHYSLPFNHYLLNLGARILHDTKFIKKDSSYNKFQIDSKHKIRKFSLLGIYKYLIDLIDPNNDNIDASYSSVSLCFVLKK